VDRWDSVSPELRQSFADSGIYLPGCEEWKQISDDLGHSTTINHVFNVIQVLAADAYSETFANFALDIVHSIPSADFSKYFSRGRLKKLSKAKWHSLFKVWLRRMRIFRFDETVTAKHLAVLRGLLNEETPLPFIDVLWYHGRIIDISIRELLEVRPAERVQRVALLLLAGLELLNIERDEGKTKKLIAAIMTATIKKQRGGPQRKPKDFTPEVCERFAKKVQELQSLWDFIIEFFQREDYDAGCAKAVKELDSFKQLSTTCTLEIPENLLKRVFERQRKGGQEYWPRTFALLHAQLELGITTKYATSTLHDFYRKGFKLLKKHSEPT
jgi:hypothetical protein